VRCVLALAIATMAAAPLHAQDEQRPRPLELGLRIGALPCGALDAITDVPGVRVGHCTLNEGESVRTGVTVVLPHGGNPFREKVPAGLAVQNGFGKLAGSTQLEELGELETPIALTNTLAVGTALDALVAWTLALPGNETVRSVNAVVGETNDARLNAIRARVVREEHVLLAIADAQSGDAAPRPVPGGAVGAGTGTACLGWKGGIGTSSRRVGAHIVGVLVQTNFGGRLLVRGRALDEATPARDGERQKTPAEHGSCMIVIATDAPLCARNLRRLAQRAFAGMARCGASFSNGSGDYAIAFCTAESQRIRDDGQTTTQGPVLRNDAMSPYFTAVADAVEQAILDSLLRATTTQGNGQTLAAVPVELMRTAAGR
jgi:D-aminopeptidase